MEDITMHEVPWTHSKHSRYFKIQNFFRISRKNVIIYNVIYYWTKTGVISPLETGDCYDIINKEKCLAG